MDRSVGRQPQGASQSQGHTRRRSTFIINVNADLHYGQILAATREPWASLSKAQDAGTEKTSDAPVLIIHSKDDDTVPLGFSQILLGRMCANDQVVERRVIDAGGHGAAAVPAYQQAIPWIDARMAGEPGEGPTAITDSCP